MEGLEEERIKNIENFVTNYHKFAYEWMYQNKYIDCNHSSLQNFILEKRFTQDSTDEDYANAIMEYVDKYFSLKMIFRQYTLNKGSQYATLRL